MSAWWASLTALEELFALIAIPSAVVLVIQTALLVIGLRGAGDFAGDAPDMDGGFGAGGPDMDGDFTADAPEPVSYTHLDVYKRQGERLRGKRELLAGAG